MRILERLFKRMRVISIPESGPKRKLLDATERLVVEKGFDLVSVRDITGAVHANVAAVNYHFGSREGLMELVMSHVMDAVDEVRMELLQGKASLDEIVSGYVSSVIDAAKRVEMDTVFFMKLAGRVMAFSSALMPAALAENRSHIRNQYLQALRSAGVSDPDLESVWMFFEAGLGQSLIHLQDGTDPESQLEPWIRFGIRGLTGAQQAVTKAAKAPVVERPAEPVAPVADEFESIETVVPDVEAVHEPTPEPAAEVVPEVAPAVVPEEKASKAKPKRPKKPDDQAMLFDF